MLIAIINLHYVFQTEYFLEKTYYASDEDQIGISRLLQNKSFSAAYPLHDVSLLFVSIHIMSHDMIAICSPRAPTELRKIMKLRMNDK